MLDFANIWIKIYEKDIYGFMSNRAYLNWETRHDHLTGEAKPFPFIAKLSNGLTITIKNHHTIELKGSLHKAFSGGSNASDFTFTNLVEFIHSLSTELNIDITRSTIHSLEYGVNVELPIPVKSFLNRLVCFKNISFTKMNNLKSGICYESQHYRIKFYDKSKQKKLNRNLLRYEVKAKKALYLTKAGIYTLSDLLDIKKLELLKADLLENYDKVLFQDCSIITSSLPQKEQQILKDGCNPKYWESITEKQHRSTRLRRRKNYDEVFNKYGVERYDQMVRKLIKEKIEYLLLQQINHPLIEHCATN